MFLAHHPGQPTRTITKAEDAAHAPWLDLIDPTEEERDMASKLCGQPLPTRADLEEIESSSRLRTTDTAVFLSTPLVRRTDEQYMSYPLGFVLTATHIVTVRYSDYAAFNLVAQQITDRKSAVRPDEVIALLMEAIVDRLADIPEHLGQALSVLSRDIFESPRPSAGKQASWQRSLLRRVGQSEDLSSMVRDSLLGLDRVSIFMGESHRSSFTSSLAPRMATISRDITSLNDFVAQMTNKIQFLLDAALGFINIEQNDGMKILTVVSFIGVTPTLIAGIYGMNFINMPELKWPLGYYYSLAAMVLSIIIPLLWFRRRGWLGGSE